MAAPDPHTSKRLPVCLIIMDGFGLAEAGPGNAISLAKTPVLDALFQEDDHVRLEASGEAVGLPAGQMGNSEVGHLNIGAGRVVYQELTRINKACADGSLARNPVLQSAFAHACGEGRALHLMGLVSDGGVHSSDEHLFALMEAAADAGVHDVRIHCFLDGRDVPPASALSYVERLEDKIEALTAAHPACSIQIASLEGRYYAMDRDKRWDRVKRAFDAIVCATPLADLTPDEALRASYDAGITDEFVEPVAFDERGVRSGDAVVFFNFRPDRARELTRAMTDEDFQGFERGGNP